MVVHLLLGIVVIICFTYWRKVWWRKRKMPPLADGALPIFGHTLRVLAAGREQLYEVLLEKMVGSSMRGGLEAVTLQCGPSYFYVLMNIEDSMVLSSILEKNFIYDFFKPLFGQGLLNSKVSLWKKHRKIMNPKFNSITINQYMGEFNRKARQLVKNVSIEVDKGPFDQLQYLKQMSYQLILTTVIGASFDESTIESDAKYIGKYYEAFTGCIVERTRRFWYYSNFLFSLSSLKREQYELSRKIKSYTEEIVRKIKIYHEEQKLSHNNKPIKDYKGFVEMLLDLSEEGSLTDEEIRDEVTTIILTGSDTIAQAVSLALLVLGTFREVQDKVYQEIEEVFEASDRDVEKQDLLRLKYLDAVIRETLRLYPLVVVFGRILDKDLRLKDYVIPRDSNCFASIYHISRHPMWGVDADQFRPERWLNPDQLPNYRNIFAVFGLGKRNCIGSNYAMMSIKTSLVHLLRQYRVTGDVTKLVRGLDIVVRIVSGHQICIENR